MDIKIWVQSTWVAGDTLFQTQDDGLRSKASVAVTSFYANISYQQTTLRIQVGCFCRSEEKLIKMETARSHVGQSGLS